MLKTISKTKQMRLDELIRYVWDNLDDLFNGYGAMLFYSRDDKGVTFDEAGLVECDDGVDKDDLFEVEIEEEITEDTEFELIIELFKKDEEYFATEYYSLSLNQILNCKTHSVYALIDDKLELIWEADHD